MPNTAAIISESGNQTHKARCAFTFEICWSVSKFFHPLLDTFGEFSAANRADVAEFYGFLGDEGYVAVAVSCPMVLAVGRVSFNGELEAFGSFRFMASVTSW